MCSQLNDIFEPELQPGSNPDEFSLATLNTQGGAHLDVAVNGFWNGQSERCFVDVRVFNPYAPSNKCSSFATAYLKHENISMPCLWLVNSGSGACLFLHLLLCQSLVD